MIQVKGDVVLAKIVSNETKTRSGLYLVHNERQYSQFAKVIALGEGIWREDLRVVNDRVVKEFSREPITEIKVGDTIIINKYSGESIDTDDGEMIFVKYKDVLAVVEENDCYEGAD